MNHSSTKINFLKIFFIHYKNNTSTILVIDNIFQISLQKLKTIELRLGYERGHAADSCINSISPHVPD